MSSWTVDRKIKSWRLLFGNILYYYYYSIFRQKKYSEKDNIIEYIINIKKMKYVNKI